MKFTVRRASEWNDNNAPCEEAKRDSIVKVEVRTLRSPEAFDEKYAYREGKWLSVGTNHRINKDGYIERDNGMVDVWSVEINTLDELIEFCNKYGDIVIEDGWQNKAYKHILIYDDYIE